MLYKNYIIIAHDNPEQLKHLIGRLDDGYAHFYVHIDKKREHSTFLDAVQSASVTWVENRASAPWGSFGLTRAIINSLRQIVADNRLHFTILLSNQCYPITDTRFINQYLEQYEQYEHIDMQPVEQMWTQYEELIYGYSIHLGDQRQDIVILPYFFKSSWRLYITRVLKIIKISFQKRKMPHFRTCLKSFTLRTCSISEHYGGPTWWAFTPMTIPKVLTFIDQHPDFVAFHQYTHVPDELFFHTILHELVTQDDTIKIRPSLTYVDWSRTKNGSPTTWGETDFEQLMAQPPTGKLFARKFEFPSDILDKIDTHLGDTTADS